MWYVETKSSRAINLDYVFIPDLGAFYDSWQIHFKDKDGNIIAIFDYESKEKAEEAYANLLNTIEYRSRVGRNK